MDVNESDHGRRSSDAVIVIRYTGITCNLSLISVPKLRTRKSVNLEHVYTTRDELGVPFGSSLRPEGMRMRP